MPDLTGLLLINPAKLHNRTAWSAVAPALFALAALALALGRRSHGLLCAWRCGAGPHRAQPLAAQGRDNRASKTTTNDDRSNNNNNDNGSVGDFCTFIAGVVTPRNFYRLMQMGQARLLFPGNVWEVWHSKGKANKIF